MQTAAGKLLCGIVVSILIAGVRSAPAALPEGFRVYEVNKRVRDFPEADDFSTPEAAYAVINRVLASGKESKWRSISSSSNLRRLPTADPPDRQVSAKEAALWLDARIVEIRTYQDKIAVVIAEVELQPGEVRYDQRSLTFEGGRWLNAGQTMHGSLQAARAGFARWCAERAMRQKRPPIDDPDAYLKPFVDFLQANAQEPHAFAMKALASHKVVIMGEIHHRPMYWAFNSSLVADPEFPKHVGTIFMELPANDQGLIDGFLAAGELNTAPVIETLRDVLWTGWPDQPILDFFVAAWQANQKLPADKKLRIVCADMHRPWKNIRAKADWRQYDVDRDRFMADTILADFRNHPGEKRNALFCVGAMHTMKNLSYFEGTPATSAGYFLREKLGDGVFAFMQHTPCMTNAGQVSGRVCLGLFESAFEAMNRKPMAFTLETGPFGQEPFDAFPDCPAVGKYGDGYDAYLYLGPLEKESFSPLIRGFYTDEFFKEIERRCEIMDGKSWSKMVKQEPAAGSFIKWMGNDWGQPRRSWSSRGLGPLDAWKYGSDWERIIGEKVLAENPQAVAQAARTLVRGIQKFDYESYTANPNLCRNQLLLNYETSMDRPSLNQWICTHLSKNPIQKVELGQVFTGKDGAPTVHYKLTLKNGSVLENDLPMYYNAKEQAWFGKHGLDWHLKYKSGPPKPLEQPG